MTFHGTHNLSRRMAARYHAMVRWGCVPVVHVRKPTPSMLLEVTR